MILISHRGNTRGAKPHLENKPFDLLNVMEEGFDVEVDVWLHNGEIYLGHDAPETRIELNFLKKHRVWAHAKNIDVLPVLLKNQIHCFFHQNDDVTLTSRGYLWTYPGRTLTPSSVCVMPEKYSYREEDLKNCAAICSDHIENYLSYR